MIPISKGLCLPSSATVQELFLLARDGGIVPDISLDPALTTFLSLDSSSALQHQYSSLQHSLSGQQLAAFNHNLTSALGGSSRVSYGGVGVVALAMSLLLDQLVQQVRSQPSGPGQVASGRVPQRMFGISSASRIGSIISGYLDQLPAVANDREKMAEVTELYDYWLKLELLDHYERMTNKKKRMGSEAMQQWLAGSAVHLHMRLHQIRLGSVPPGSAESLRLSYKTGFSHLVQAYTAYLRRNVQETAPPRRAAGKSQGHGTSVGSDGAIPQGLLSIEPLRNVSHAVRHRPCESQAIAEGLVTRIMAAQDPENSRRFYRYAEVNFNSLVAQLEDFESNLTPEVIS